MLSRLEIKNFAIISHSVFEPQKGLNVISGETGAGKSLLIDAIGLILGDKATKTLIRTNENKAYVEAVFDFVNVNTNVIDNIKSDLESAGVEFDENSLIVTREISNDGRSNARINGRTVVLSLLKSVTSRLIDIHGQNDTQKIFDESTHLNLLDGYIGEDINVLKDEYRSTLSRYKDIVLSIKKLGSSPEQRLMRKEFLSFAVNEIKDAKLIEGEEEKLSELKAKYSNSAKIALAFEQMNELVGINDQSGSSKVKIASGILSKLATSFEEYSDLSARLESISLDLDSIAEEISSEADKFDNSEAKLDEINSRISLIYSLKSKYGDSIEEINSYLENAQREIDEIDKSGDTLIKLKAERHSIESELLSLANKMSQIRHNKASELSSRIIEELVDLEMPQCEFFVEFKEHSKDKYFSINGTEDISFAFSANPGESPKPLSKIASGGEASRIMLAIKTILSEVDETGTLVFDEIDTGISGIASLKVAQKLKRISNNHQVLSVSHTAQIAAAATENFYIHKEIGNNSSETKIDNLDYEGKLKEVSRLLSGTTNSESLDLAKSLINQFL